MADALWKPNLLADSIQPALGRTWGPEYLQNMQRQVWRVRGCLANNGGGGSGRRELQNEQRAHWREREGRSGERLDECTCHFGRVRAQADAPALEPAPSSVGRREWGLYVTDYMKACLPPLAIRTAVPLLPDEIGSPRLIQD